MQDNIILRLWLILICFFIPLRCNGTGVLILANEVYVYRENDIQSPSNFLYEILRDSGLMYYTIPPLVSIHPITKPGNSTYTSAAWILGFIIPCGVVLILLPCWILLCVSILSHFIQLVVKCIIQILNLLIVFKVIVFY